MNYKSKLKRENLLFKSSALRVINTLIDDMKFIFPCASELAFTLSIPCPVSLIGQQNHLQTRPTRTTEAQLSKIT